MRYHPNRIYPGGVKPKTYSSKYRVPSSPLENTEYYVVELEERVSLNTWHKIEVIGFTQTSGIPSQTEFYVDADQGLVFFHKFNQGREVIITYQGLGTPTRMTLLNDLGSTGTNNSPETIPKGGGIGLYGNAVISGESIQLSFAPWTPELTFVGVAAWEVPPGGRVTAQTTGLIEAPVMGANNIGDPVFLVSGGGLSTEGDNQVGIVGSISPSVVILSSSGGGGGGSYDWYILKKIQEEY